MNRLVKRMKMIAKKTNHKMNKIIMRLIMMNKLKMLKMKKWMKNQIRIFQICNKKILILMQFKKIKMKINQMKIMKKMQGMNREIYNNL